MKYLLIVFAVILASEWLCCSALPLLEVADGSSSSGSRMTTVALHVTPVQKVSLHASADYTFALYEAHVVECSSSSINDSVQGGRGISRNTITTFDLLSLPHLALHTTSDEDDNSQLGEQQRCRSLLRSRRHQLWEQKLYSRSKSSFASSECLVTVRGSGGLAPSADVVTFNISHSNDICAVILIVDEGVEHASSVWSPESSNSVHEPRHVSLYIKPSAEISRWSSVRKVLTFHRNSLQRFREALDDPPPPATPSPPVPCTNAGDCNGNAAVVEGNRPKCSCKCNYGWDGNNCELVKCTPADCSDHATVVFGTRPDLCLCVCHVGWADPPKPNNRPYCSVDVTCSIVQDCNNHATQVTGKRPSCQCTCTPDRIGMACDVSNVCTQENCNFHAVSVSGNRPNCQCACTSEWVGNVCGISSVCTIAEDCSNRATRVTGRRYSCNCECFPQWTGASCLQSNMCTIAGDCSGHGTNVSGIRPNCTCTCPGEWIGSKCEISNMCTSAVDCNNHAGRVVGNRPNCTCYCLAAYHGKTCDVTRTVTRSSTKTEPKTQSCTLSGTSSQHFTASNPPSPSRSDADTTTTTRTLSDARSSSLSLQQSATSPRTHSKSVGGITQTSSLSQSALYPSTTMSSSASRTRTMSASVSASYALSTTYPQSETMETVSELWSSTESITVPTRSIPRTRSSSRSILPSQSLRTRSGTSTLSLSQSSSLRVSPSSSVALLSESPSVSVYVSETPPFLSLSNSSSFSLTMALTRPTLVAPSITFSGPFVSTTASVSTTITPLPCEAIDNRSEVRVVLSPLTTTESLLSSSSGSSSFTPSSLYTTLTYQNQTFNEQSVKKIQGFSSVPAAPVASAGIDRWTLTRRGDDGNATTIVANLTIYAAGQRATGLRVKNVTLNGNILLQHSYPYSGDSWHVVTLASTTAYGWVSASLWKSVTISVDVYMTCGDDDAIRVHVIVPAPGLQERLAAEVKATTLSTQLFSLAAGGASSGAVLGRVLATRSLFMCDADAAVGGGVLDLGFVLCSTEDNSNNIARSAVMSNIVLLGIVGLAIVLFGVLLSLVDPTHSDVLRTTAAIMLLPSSLLTVFGTIIPSTTTSAALLAARFGASACSALDAVLVIVAIVIVATPILTLLLLYRYALRNGKWECAERHEVPVPPRKSNSNHFMARVATVLREASRRRYQWRCCEGDDAMIKRSWAVLLEYRVLWYAAVDSSALVAVGVFSIAGGLSVVAGGETPSSCTPFAAIVIVLLCAQLLVVVAVRPYTTMFESIYVVATLTLSLVSVAGQLVFVVNTATPGGGQGSEWALMLSAICDLSTVGVSLMKSIMSGQTVALGIYRRVAHAVSLRKKSQHHERATKDDAANNDFTALNVGVVQEEDEEHHRGDRFLFLESEGETDVNNYLNREALYSDSRSDHSTPESQGDAQMIAEIENQFWDADGVARLGGGSDEHRNSSHEVVDRLHDGPHLQLW